MAWDTARTKQKLLDAAVHEFSEHGPLGARVDRVASRAGVNKERIYQYFGSKQNLFSAVLEQEMIKLAAAVPLTPELAHDLGEFSGRIYDYHREYPHYLRLLLWEGLDRNPLDGNPPAARDERAEHYAGDRRVVALAQATRRSATTSHRHICSTWPDRWPRGGLRSLPPSISCSAPLWPARAPTCGARRW